MSRNIGPKCRLCRREGQKLFLKGDRCFSDKCAIARKAYPPGMHGQAFKKLSGYGKQLREKQKASRIYGLTARQFQNYFKKASRLSGSTGENLLRMLETRLDNIIHRLGLANSPSTARQLANHGHFTLNGRHVDIASHQLKPGDVIELRKKNLKENLGLGKIKAKPPAWINFDPKNLKAEILEYPPADYLKGLDLNVQLIVEFYSR